MGDDVHCERAPSGRTPVDVVGQTDEVLASRRTRPFWPVHIVVVPKKHAPSLIGFEAPALPRQRRRAAEVGGRADDRPGHSGRGPARGRALRFHRAGPGLATDGVTGTSSAQPPFDLRGGPGLAPSPRGSIANDTGLPRGAASATGFAPGQNAPSPEEVDAAARTPPGRRRAGARGNILAA